MTLSEASAFDRRLFDEMEQECWPKWQGYRQAIAEGSLDISGHLWNEMLNDWLIDKIERQKRESADVLFREFYLGC